MLTSTNVNIRRYNINVNIRPYNIRPTIKNTHLDVHALQAKFTERTQAMAKEHNKTAVFWDEVLDLPGNAVPKGQSVNPCAIGRVSCGVHVVYMSDVTPVLLCNLRSTLAVSARDVKGGTLLAM